MFLYCPARAKANPQLRDPAAARGSAQNDAPAEHLRHKMRGARPDLTIALRAERTVSCAMRSSSAISDRCSQRDQAHDLELPRRQRQPADWTTV
jgi:hypothetical protein